MPARILVAEADADALRLLENTLHEKGYFVTTASSGAEVLQQVSSAPYDLLLLGLSLPADSGMDLLRLVRSAHPDLRIIVISSRRSFEAAVKGMHYQISDYLVKPLTPRKVLHSVDRALEMHRAAFISEPRSPYLLVEDQVALLKDDMRINFTRRLIEWPGGQVHLTPSESRLLGVFIDNPGRVLSASEILKSSQGYEVTQAEASMMLRPLVSRLRHKLAVVPGGEKWIANIRGAGYIYERREKE